jgi:hypothetical protein
MRTFFDPDQIAGLIAVHEGYNPATMTYAWQVSRDGVFEGIVIMHASPKEREAA